MNRQSRKQLAGPSAAPCRLFLACCTVISLAAPALAADAGLRSSAFRAEVAEFPSSGGCGHDATFATRRILGNSATRNFEDAGRVGVVSHVKVLSNHAETSPVPRRGRRRPSSLA